MPSKQASPREGEGRSACLAERMAREIIPKWTNASAANTMEYENALEAQVMEGHAPVEGLLHAVYTGDVNETVDGFLKFQLLKLGAARAVFRPPTHPVFSGIGRGLERGASSMATTGQCWPPHGAWGAGDTCPLPPPLFLLITPTQQPRRHQRRLKALVGAEPAESPAEGHGAGDWGGGARRLGAGCESWESSTHPS